MTGSDPSTGGGPAWILRVTRRVSRIHVDVINDRREKPMTTTRAIRVRAGRVMASLVLAGASLLALSPAASAASGDWGKTQNSGADLYGCTNPWTCGPGAQHVSPGWVQVWCYTDSWWIRWFNVRAYANGQWQGGWIPANQIAIQPRVPHC